MQASFLNEINWKIEQDLVFPYHYRPEEYKHALERIAALMERVDDDVIFTAPRSSEFLNHFFVSHEAQLAPLPALRKNEESL